MSTTLGTLLQELEPNWSIALFETLDQPGQESSDPWNNAGTGHTAYCELNYTPRGADGAVDTAKAAGIAEQFHVSRQLWSHWVEQGTLGSPRTFINALPHMSFVWGDENADYLKDGNNQCKVLDGLLKATIGSFTPLFCNGPLLKS